MTLAQKTHNYTTGFPVSFLNFPGEKTKREFSCLYLDLAKESYKYIISLGQKTDECSAWTPHHKDSSTYLPICEEDINRFKEALKVYVEFPSEECPAVLGLAEATDKCFEFCNSRGLISDLRKCLNEAKKNFSNRTSLCAELSHFEDELSTDEGHVVIRLEIASDSQTVSAEYNAWVDWMVDNISPNNVGMFTLTIRRR